MKESYRNMVKYPTLVDVSKITLDEKQQSQQTLPVVEEPQKSRSDESSPNGRPEQLFS